MPKLDQRGVIHLLVPLILLLGIIGGVYLITAGPLKLFPKASVSGPIGGVTYVDTKIGCGNPQGLTPDQICQQKGFIGAVAVEGNYAAKGYWWRQCGGASVSNCNGLDCTVNNLDCTNTSGYWGSQQPYPENFLRVGTPTTVYQPAGFDVPNCAGYAPGWTMRVACSLSGGSVSGPVSPSPTLTPSPSPVKGFGKAAKFNGGAGQNASYIFTPWVGSRLSNLNPRGPMTLETWIRIDKPLSSSDYSYLIYKVGTFQYPGGPTNAPIYYLQLRGNQLTLLINDTSSRKKGFASAVLPTGEVSVWHHIAGVYNTTDVRIFIDGVEKGRGNLETETAYPLTNDDEFFAVGAASLHLIGGSTVSLPVAIDEVRISNIARYTANFLSSTIPFVSDTNTLLLWHLDRDRGGDQVEDAGPNGIWGQMFNTLLIDSTIVPSPSPSPIACTINDLRAAFFSRRGEPKYNPACDINNDGRISVADYSALLRNLRR